MRTEVEVELDLQDVCIGPLQCLGINEKIYSWLLHFQSMFWIFFSATCVAQESLLLHIALFTFIACSCQATLASGWEQKRQGGKKTIMCRMHLLLSECSLTYSPLSGSRLKLNQKWTGKICWSAKRYPANQEMVARFLLSYYFSWRVNRTTAGDREGRLAADVPDGKWWTLWSVKILSLCWEQESCYNLHEESRTDATLPACILFFETS